MPTGPDSARAKPSNRVLGGLAAVPAQARFCLWVLKERLFHARRHPLLRLAPWHQGFSKTLWLLARLRMTKVVQAGGGCHFSLIEPRWPSPAYDALLGAGGLSLAAAGTEGKRQIDLVILGVSRTCPYRCLHCYERHNLASAQTVPIARWSGVVREVQEVGTSVIALSGGEPMTRFDDVLLLLAHADRTRSDFHLFTSGHGVTAERVRALVAEGLVGAAVGLDHHDPERNDARRGPGAFATAVEAIRRFVEGGLLTYVNTCLTRDLAAGDGLWRFYDLLHDLGVGAVQLLEPQRCGGLASVDLGALYGAEERRRVRAFFEASYRERRYRGHPAVFWPADMESPAKLGCMMAGLSHLSIDSVGNVEPCPFLPVSFGNVLEEGFAPVYRRMRAAAPRPLHDRCPSAQLAERVGFAPDGGRVLPLPYAAVRADWERMFRRPASAHADTASPKP